MPRDWVKKGGNYLSPMSANMMKQLQRMNRLFKSVHLTSPLGMEKDMHYIIIASIKRPLKCSIRQSSFIPSISMPGLHNAGRDSGQFPGRVDDQLHQSGGLREPFPARRTPCLVLVDIQGMRSPVIKTVACEVPASGNACVKVRGEKKEDFLNSISSFANRSLGIGLSAPAAKDVAVIRRVHRLLRMGVLSSL